MKNFAYGKGGKPNFSYEKQTLSAKGTTLKRLSKYTLSYKNLVIFALFLAISSNVLSLIGPKIVENSIEIIEKGPGMVDMVKISYLSLFMIFFYLLANGLSFILRKIMMNLGQSICFKLRRDAFNKFETLPVSYFDNHQAGDIISRFTYDIDVVGNSVGQSFLSFSTGILTIIGSLIMMTQIKPELMMGFVFTIPVSIGLGIFWTKKVRGFHRDKAEKNGELNSYAEDKISGHKTIKIYNREKNVIDEFAEKNTSWAKAHYKSDFMGNGILPAGLGFVTNFTTAFIYVHGCILYIMSDISLGQITGFILYAKMLTGVVNEFSFILAELQSSLAAADRVFSLIDEKDEVADMENAEEVKDAKGEIKLDNISFGYRKDKKIIHDLHLDVGKGEIVAIVGHTGAGKTTLINLLMRFYDTDDGCILMDGKEIKSLKRNSVRKSYAMVLQDTWLFNGTFYDNIAYGNDDITKDDVVEVAKAVSIHDYISSLPQGYDTDIGNNGVNISQGQKQLITIARAMLLEAKILILDEATSNVDTITEIEVQKSMKKLMKGKTCFVIAHRLSTIKNADVILVMEQGNIVESGTHKELLALNGNYAKLYNYQFNTYKKIEGTEQKGKRVY